MLTPSRMFYTATISVGELGVLFLCRCMWFRSFCGGSSMGCSRRFGDCSSPSME